MVQYSSAQVDAAFAALSDPTRRGILERLGQSDASITDLADKFDLTLTGMKKHVQILERSGLVSTEKVGRVRTCTLGPKRLEHEAAWLAKHRLMLEERLDRLGKFLERTKGEEDHEHHDRQTARSQSHRHHARRS
jgi:DNA-binding transcriptional ArsR family regulator